MILTVDDDASVLETVKTVLEKDGFRVETFGDPEKAMEYLAGEEPELIISDVMMPGMGGIDFKEAYSRRFSSRATPFIFLSSLSDTASMVKGLECGVDDYLVKPIIPDFLRAKVRSILARKTRYSISTFHGDLQKMPFVNIIKFCELNGMTGDLEIRSETINTTIKFQAGDMIVDDTDDDFDEVLNKLFDLTSGTFAIYSKTIDYKEIEDSTAEFVEQADKPPVSDKKAMGQLSGVKVGKRLFQIQTEHVVYPENRIVTIVVLDGKIVMKNSSPPLETDDLEEIGKIIKEKHAGVEAEVKGKINSLTQKESEDEESAQERFNRLFEEGFDKYREKDYAGALAVWEEAQKINPGNNTLEINMKIVRKKLKEMEAEP